MGARAQETVTIHSKQTSVDLLRLLGILAMGADDDTGVVDPAPNRQTLARLMECEERTITNRIKKLLDSGELEQLRVGSGPGNPSAFRLKLEIAETTLLKGETKGEAKGEKGEREKAKGEKGENLSQLSATLTQQMGEIRAEIFTLYEQIEALKGEILDLKGERVKAKGGKGESSRVKGHSFKIADDPIDPSFDPLTQCDARARELPADELLWAEAQRLVGRWQSRTGSFRRLNPGDEGHRVDYFAPALAILADCGGDPELAWSAVEAEFGRMLQDGLTGVRKLAPVVTAALGERQRAKLPPRPSKNGHAKEPPPDTGLKQVAPGLY